MTQRGFWHNLKRLLQEDAGVTATEYAVLLALILLVAISGIQIHGLWLNDKLTLVNSLVAP